MAGFDKLTPAEQIFAIADIERTARGLPPVAAITRELDEIAAAGASDQADPSTSLPLVLGGGGTSTYYASNWAEGTANGLGADYFWMYDDGPDSRNASCQKSGQPACWGHRDNILGDFANSKYCAKGSHINIVMGAAEVTANVTASPSIAEIFLNDCGALPKDQVFTWAQVKKDVFGH